MKKADLILTSDWHLRESIPVCRTDDFELALWKKVQFVSTLQREHDCPVLHGGDLFHHWKPSPALLSKTMFHLPQQFHTIYGQHDLPNHNFEERSRSGINVLSVADVLKVLGGTHWGGNPEIDKYPSFVIPHPVVPKEHHPVRSVLVWHHMVWQGKRPWPGCTSPSAVAILKKYPEYDLILTGDNHKAFVETYDDRLLVNPGSLTRQSADQITFKPRVYLYYADGNRVEPVYIPIREDAVTRIHLDRSEGRSERIDSFISKLGGEWDTTLNFEDNLKAFLQNNKVLESVKSIIYKAIDDGENTKA